MENEIIQNNKLTSLADSIVCLIDSAKKTAAVSVSSIMVKTYWAVGKHIVEFEQNGNSKAEYGTQLLTNLAKILTLKLGKGYSRPNLNNMRKFYVMYPNLSDMSDKLTWSHICELIKIDDELERTFYLNECIQEKWDVRSLRRQMDSALYLRLASSKNTLEFLGLPEKSVYSEKDLEDKIIDNLQSFLLELGKGFTFVKRQYPLTINNIHYHVDLVFYHRILKCFVLIDLKKNSVKHEDIGQMNMYMGYFAKEENEPDDNPPIGIILSHNKDELLVEYATYGMDSNLFVAKYELYLPNKEELKRLVDGIIKDN